MIPGVEAESSPVAEAAAGAGPADAIRVRGARTHNLQNVDLDIPRDRLVVLTGPSGSGKSSLAFDTLYAEGQRQYIESLSVYARQFLHQLPRPDVDLIEGLQPTICIDQRPGTANPRSTVATVTEIYDYLRLLLARLGEVCCPQCGEPIRQQSAEQIDETLAGLPDGTRLMILAPLVRGRRGKHDEALAKIRKAGFIRVRIDGELCDLEDLPDLDTHREHCLDAVVDRLIVRSAGTVRLAESVRLALRHGEGVLIACYQEPGPTAADRRQNDWRDRLFSTRYACPNCDLSVAEIEPRTFSFNSPYGACPRCGGLGCIEPPGPEPDARAAAPDEDGGETSARFRDQVTCPTCQGSRLRPEANAVRVGGKTIHEICLLPIAAAVPFFRSLQFPAAQRPLADPLLKEILQRLAFLEHVGVTYLTLHRAADTLSGGELQRVRLATSIGSGLVGVCYVLDEPSIGLHPRDNRRLIDALRNLQQQGNSVLVVEHDEAMMREADQLIDVGPGAGVHGGRIVAQGSVEEVCGNPASLTGRYLSGRAQIPVPPTRRRISKTRSLTIEGVTTHNLHDVEARFPLEALVCVTGVSGSGKSSLVNETLAPELIRRTGGVAPQPGPFRSLRGAAQIDKVVEIDQRPIGRTPRSSPATYSGAFDEIRKVFARTREAKQRGFGASRFSFNVKGGRCEACQGHGLKKIEMQFLPDLYVTCSECAGARFNRQTLEIRYRDKSIADVLAMPIDEATEFFQNFPTIHRGLKSLQDVGLGYLTLGQPSPTLSGGEAQRIKLATELSRVDTGRTLYLLDEPTTGLHFDDIRCLLEVLGRLVDRGNTVIVIEHNLEVIKCADWVIDLGPEGGDAGGRVVATGTPEEVAASQESYTGMFLRNMLVGTGSVS